MESIQQLKLLYAQTSKHAHYQILSKRLRDIINEDQLIVKSRYEEERLDYILQHVEMEDKFILDVGGNTGFFTFELIDKGAKKVHYYEGNETHTTFVQLASEILDVEKKIKITNNYFSFENEFREKEYDIILLLNVLHHVGDDYGGKSLSIEKAKEKMIESLKNLSSLTDILVFQLGFCWKGNRDLLLFENGTKTELINFIKKGIEAYWEIVDIGIPVLEDKKLSYAVPRDGNLKRRDDWGEFLNRPLFILKSKK